VNTSILFSIEKKRKVKKTITIKFTDSNSRCYENDGNTLKKSSFSFSNKKNKKNFFLFFSEYKWNFIWKLTSFRNPLHCNIITDDSEQLNNNMLCWLLSSLERLNGIILPQRAKTVSSVINTSSVSKKVFSFVTNIFTQEQTSVTDLHAFIT